MDEELISDWFDAYADDIYRFLVYYTATSDVEDLLQDVFIRAIDRYDSFRAESSPKTWLISIARNLAIDEERKRNEKIGENSFLYMKRGWRGHQRIGK